MIKAVVDIETDSLDATKIHCIVAKDYSSDKKEVWKQNECLNFSRWSKGIDQFIMHNGVSFDAPILNRLTGSKIEPKQVRDTLIESQLDNPIREKGHSLKSWGELLKFPKKDFKEFSEYTSEMLEYCENDVELTKKLAKHLDKTARFSPRSYDLERKVRTIIDQQEANGFAFDLNNAILLLNKLNDEQHSLEEKAKEMFEPKEIKMVTKTKYEPFNIASRKQIAEQLQKLGWKFSKKTDKNNIVINEAVLSEIPMEEAKMFNRYFLLQKRTGLLKSWISECQDDRRVRGKVLTLRTLTGRMAHHSPNMAQVPAVYSPYGKECRSLWTVSNPETHYLVGTDAKGLELRCLAHFLDNEKYTKEVVEGDIHTVHQKLAELPTRDHAKTFIYAFLYGAGPYRIGQVIGRDYLEGRKLIETFLKRMPDSLTILKEKLEDSANKDKSIVLPLDFRRLQVKPEREYAVLNTLIQGSGAVVCKQWLVDMILGIQRLGLDAKLVVSVHDEYRFEGAKPDVKRFCSLTKEAIYKTEKTLEMRCALDCDYKVGKTWADTH